MASAAFATLGCKVNQYETQRILDDFEEYGFSITEFNQQADVYVINTCSVTQAAERKSRYMVRKLARQNPDAVVVMTGCYGEMAAIRGEGAGEAHLVVPNSEKLQTLQHLLASYPHFLNTRSEKVYTAAQTKQHRTRATIKVQDGCNVYCSFCSIPYTRKVMASRPMDELVAEVESRAAQGYSEVVVTGVLVGAYGQDTAGSPAQHWSPDREYSRPDLADLLLAFAKVEGIQRVRLSSIEPTQVTKRLLAAFASEPKLCPHLHIPLQSGDSGVLAKMNRPYSHEFYLERCLEAKAMIPNLAISADIMVGFPGETREAFENTVSMVHEVRFARAHLFRYSQRSGTPAADMPDQISDAEKEARSSELTRACREAQVEFINRHLGATMEVLVEGKDRQLPSEPEGETGNDQHARLDALQGSDLRLLSGYTANYIRVQFSGGSHLIGKMVPVYLMEHSTDGAVGEAGGAHFSALEAPPDADFIPLATLQAALV